MSLPRRLDCVVAGDDRETVSKSIGEACWNFLAAKGFATGTSIGWVGFARDLDSDSLLVVLPKAFSAEPARHQLEDVPYRREQIYRLIRVFRKIRRANKIQIKDTESHDVLSREQLLTDPILDSFDAALTLRREYRKNSVYIRKTPMHVRSKPQLPVHWERTVRYFPALMSNSEIVYAEFAHRSRCKDPAHPLSLLHLSCLKEIYTFTGEKLGLEGAEGLGAEAFRAIKRKPRPYLRRMRSSVFDERGRFLLSAIGAYLGESSLQRGQRKMSEQLLSYSKDFELIWEQILRDLLAPGMTERTLPAGEWRAYPSGGFTEGKKPVLDILFRDGVADVIADAKDYRVLNGSKILGYGGDYYKQVLYRLLLPSPEPEHVLNILAFPSVGQKSLFRIRGCHSWKQLSNSRVFEVTVDYDLATKLWLKEIALNIKEEIKVLVGKLLSFSSTIEKGH